MATTTTTKTNTKSTTTGTARNKEVVGAIQHIEIVTTEPVKAKKFFEKQFGWTFETTKMPGGAGEYHSFRTPDGNGGGVLAPQNEQPIAVTPYINVQNIESVQKGCEKNGATILMPTTPVPGMGKFFIFQVQGGPPLACWEADNASRN